MAGVTGPRLRAPANRLDRRAVTWWRLTAGVDVALLLVLVAGVWWWWEAARAWVVPIGATAVALAAARAVVMPIVRFRVHRWETTEDAVYASSGWLVRQWRIAPITRIQTVDTTRGPLQQALGLATLVVTTASAVGPIRVAGMTVGTAMEVAAELTRLAAVEEGDAT